jgi:cytochrome c2
MAGMNQARKVTRWSFALLGLFLLAGCSRADPQPEPATGGSPQRGKQLIEAYGCASCHTISGIRTAHGLVGPPLTNIKSRAYIGGVLANKPDNLENWIMHPNQYSPNTAMPDLGVSPAQARDIAAYLYSR